MNLSVEKPHRSRSIAQVLRTRILTGEWKSHQKLPTELELASEFGVARSTVVRSLRRVEEDGLVWCRHGEGRFVVEPQRRRRTSTIGVVVHDIALLSYPVTQQYLSGVHHGCLGNGYHEQIFGLNPRVEQNGLGQLLEQLDQSRLDGVVLMTWLIPEPYVIELSQRVPVVWLSRFSLWSRVGTVTPDSIGGMFDVTRHLTDLGHRDIALITIGADKLQGSQQREGVRLGMRAALGTDRFPRVITAKANITDEWAPAFRAMFASPAGRPTAVVFGSDELALVGVGVLRELGLNIPRDVSVVASGDVIEPSRFPVPLTALHLNLPEVGRESIEMLMRMIADPSVPLEPKHVATELIVRESTAPPLRTTTATIT